MILATNNKGKLREIREIFDGYEIYSLRDRNICIDVLEDASTFYGNALKKAKAVYDLTNEPVIADDSGLCIIGLDDFPGVQTARFLGENVSDEDRNKELISRTNALSDRSAKVVCNLVYYDGKNICVGEGIIYGKISDEIRGTNGFGFDPIFELDSGKTLAELSSEEKNIVSARYLAAIDLLNKLQSIKVKTKTL